MKYFKEITHIFDWLNKVSAIIAAIILVFSMLIVSVEVAMRFFFNRPIVWVVEITEFGLLFITFLSAAWIMKHDGHVRMDIFLHRLSPHAQTLVNFCTSIISAIVCIIIVWYSSQATWIHYQKGTYIPSFLNIPNVFVLWVIPAGMFLLFIQFINNVFNHLIKLLNSKS